MSLKKNEFSWSKSRHDVFRVCLRRYWYAYYASWGGWDEGAPPLVRELHILKKLKTREMWVGDLVHRAIERSLTNLSRGITVLTPERIIDITMNLMRNEYRSSKRGEYRTSKRSGLFEHEYGIQVSDDEWRSSARDVVECLKHFYSSGFWSSLVARPREDILEVEQLSGFMLEGTRMWVALDVAFRGDHGIQVADWKTGRTEPGGHELQLTGYALYAADRWGVAPHEVTLVEYNLRHDKVHQYRADEGTVARTTSYILGSIADMKTLLCDAAENTPLPEERFIKAEKPDICSWCNFLKVCRPNFG